MSLRRLSVAAAAGMTIGPLTGTPVRADAPTPAGLNPGDHFRLVFVTSAATAATSTNLSTYDSFVSADAASAGFDTYGGSPVTWQVLGSLEGGASAISRFNPTSPIYGLDANKIADNGTDLWDGSIQHQINKTPSGATLAAGTEVWTGTTSSGANAKGLGGNINVFTEYGVIATDSTWIDLATTTAASSELHNLYAFSNELTVVPEPASAGLVALGVTLAATRRQTRRGTRRR